MNFILWLIIGSILGWIASLMMHTDAQQGIFLNVVVGMIGTIVAGLLLTPLLGIDTIYQNNLYPAWRGDAEEDFPPRWYDRRKIATFSQNGDRGYQPPSRVPS